MHLILFDQKQRNFFSKSGKKELKSLLNIIISASTVRHLVDIRLNGFRARHTAPLICGAEHKSADVGKKSPVLVIGQKSNVV